MLFNKQSKILQLAARILLSSIFIYSAINKIVTWETTIQFMESKGIPIASVFFVGAILVELAGSLSLLFKYKYNFGALLLILYLIPTTLIFHNFWAYEGQQFSMQLINFFKNLSIMGGLLLLPTIKRKAE